MLRKIVLLFVVSLLTLYGKAQVCSTLGQTPQTAFPVCGLDTFYQTTVPICTNTNIPVPGCTGAGIYTDKNPYWYKFTCYAAGTLGFLITPNNLGDDYDWQLLDITNHTPADVYTDSTLFVIGNWSGSYGLTGASNAGNTKVECASDPAQKTNTFSYMPTLIVGHTYLLMVSHYTSSQSGYKLSFGGGTASITDPSPPTFLSASAICGGDKIYFKTSKRIKCSSIAKNGTDFALSPAVNAIDSAIGYGCTTGFDTDSIVIYLSNYLTPNNYTLYQQIGTDGNTLLDICGSAILAGDNKTFNITAQQLLKAGFTYNVQYGCKQDIVSITMGGRNISNYMWYIDGNPVYTVNPVIIYKEFGSKSIKLIASNSVCMDSVVVNYTLPIPDLKAIINGPDFACPQDSIAFKNASTGNPITWQWDFSNGQTSTLQNPPAQNYPLVTAIKEFPVRLIISDTACSDTTYHLIKIIPNSYIAVPGAFTPNGDGLNDYLYPLNAYKAENLDFSVYNRFGQIIFQTTNWLNKWNGTFKGIPQPTGTYVWILTYTEKDTSKKVTIKGTTVLIR